MGSTQVGNQSGKKSKLNWLRKVLDYVELGGNIAALTLPPGASNALGLIIQTVGNANDTVRALDETTQATIESLKASIEADAPRILAQIRSAKQEVANDTRD